MSREAHMIAKLRALFPPLAWAFFTQVRNAIGISASLRIVDAIAACLVGPGPLELHAFEVKESRKDWQRELEDPDKSGAFRLFCTAFWIVVPAPWKRVVLHPSELRETWGLIEVGPGDPKVIVEARCRVAEPPTEDFLRALLAAADRRPGPGEEVNEAPRRLITRRLSRDLVGLECLHTAPRPLVKVAPRELPCVPCAEGRPPERAVIEAALEDASAEDLARYSAAITRRCA